MRNKGGGCFNVSLEGLDEPGIEASVSDLGSFVARPPLRYPTKLAEVGHHLQDIACEILLSNPGQDVEPDFEQRDNSAKTEAKAMLVRRSSKRLHALVLRLLVVNSGGLEES